MGPTEFQQRHAERWRRLAALVERAERRGLETLEKHELDELALGYRRAAADLATAQQRFPGSDLVDALNALVARGHAAVYRARRPRWRELRGLVGSAVPALVRRRWAYVAVAAALLLGPAGVAYGVGRARPDVARAAVPAAMHEAADEGRLHTDGLLSAIPASVLSSSIAVNNLGVAFAAFAGGLALGIGTLWILVANGLLVGLVLAFYANVGLAKPLWGFLLPHGVVEISAIALAGGAGLLLGDALIAPGERRRADALVGQGREAVTLVLGLVPVLLVAGLVEGHVSPNPAVPFALKVALGVALGVLLWGWLLRPPPRRRGGGPADEGAARRPPLATPDRASAAPRARFGALRSGAIAVATVRLRALRTGRFRPESDLRGLPLSAAQRRLYTVYNPSLSVRLGLA